MDTHVKELADLLGPGTESLTLRIGLNSGNVTAGVLRGEKSRFQLFGDTVNTGKFLLVGPSHETPLPFTFQQLTLSSTAFFNRNLRSCSYGK